MIEALGGFILGFLRNRSEGAPVLCVKELGLLTLGPTIVRAVPSSKFILMIRDERAQVLRVGAGKHALLYKSVPTWTTLQEHSNLFIFT